ncbi:hypothetical protein AX16_005483 [Volvariella volvacea WC 439]|nr:hypothetical protein AX16_005483 [Volvariella volvacea WC 439]
MSLGIAIVTGASQGIGRAIALRLAKDGYNLGLNDLPRAKESLASLAKEIEASGRKALVVPGDVSVEADVKNLVETVYTELGGLDVMVANAGICVPQPISQTAAEDWDRTFAINARGTFLSYKFAADKMIAQGRGGRIIGASSLAGKQGSSGLSAYASTKFAIRGLTQVAAAELREHGITVNAYAPGAIDTPMFRNTTGSLRPEDLEAASTPQFGANVGVPDDIACLVSYLASKESKFITGQTISINGGMYFD